MRGDTPGAATAMLGVDGCNSSPPEVTCTVSPTSGDGIDVSFQAWPTLTSSSICTSPLLPPASTIARVLSYTSRSPVAFPESAGISPGCEQSKRIQRVPAAMARILANCLAGSATAANRDISSFASIPSIRVSWAVIRTVCNRFTSRRNNASTATRLVSSAEILFHESIRPSSFESSPHREPPVLSHRDWSTLPLWLPSMSR